MLAAAKLFSFLASFFGENNNLTLHVVKTAEVRFRLQQKYFYGVRFGGTDTCVHTYGCTD
jgi:hypothetical protein